jgi:hypothetical protein
MVAPSHRMLFDSLPLPAPISSMLISRVSTASRGAESGGGPTLSSSVVVPDGQPESRPFVHERSWVNPTLIVTGSVFVAAAIAGKGLEGAGIKIPALDKGWQHLCLAALGLLVIATGTLPQLLAKDTPVSQPTVRQPGSSTSSPSSSASSGPSAAPALSSVSLIDLSVVDPENDGYSVDPATVDKTTYKNVLISNGDLCDAYGSVTYRLAGEYKHFHALVGLTDDSESGEDIDFSITVNNGSTPTGVIQAINVGESPKPIDADITGAFSITLSAVTPDCVFGCMD